ncbi:MAG: 4-hydroxy-tetrahydrodipicolinate synthase [Deltaproteobacteria bacterium]|nr:4-hydroxy-tetrahydrodipicolinate synthase [Deltaproteobacteria bacterium]
MKTPLFTGSMVALITPFKDGKVDEAALKQLIDWQIENGSSVIVPCGSTGESATLTHSEHDRVIELTVEHVNRRVKVLAGTGSNATAEAIRLTQHAKDVGADGSLLICPYYNKPTQEGLFLHFEAIAKAVDLPQILYNIPGRTGINMTPETVARLSQVDRIVGIKEATGNLIQASEVIAQCRKDFVLLSGEDALNWPLYTIGAQGAISVTANLFPQKCAEMWSCIQKQDLKRGLQLHYELLEINQVLFIETNPTPVKAALEFMGRCSGDPRLPLTRMKKENLEKLKQTLKHYQLI